MFRARQRKTLKRKGVREDSPEAAGQDGVAFVVDDHGNLVVDETTVRFRDESPSKRSRLCVDSTPTTADESPTTADEASPAFDEDDEEAWEDEVPEVPEPPVSICSLIVCTHAQHYDV